MSKPDGGSAFPWGEHGTHLGGMTLRDYFAAQAMQGWIASFPADSRHPCSAGHGLIVASLSYEMADAMLTARGVQQ
jgi:hypothetical protein